MVHPTLACVVAFIFAAAARAAAFDPAAATNQVGLELYQLLAAKQPGANLVISPYSIQSALALAYAGADGKTKEEMSAALHFPPDSAAVHPAFAELRRALAAMATKSAQISTARQRAGNQVYTIIGGKRVELQNEPGPAIEWHAANRVYAQDGYAFRESYLTLMRDAYAAPLQRVDFRSDAAQARTAINDWVRETTREKIPELIPPRGVTRDTRLVLVNALYLKAPWQTPFEKPATRPRPFHLPEGRVLDVPTMQRTSRLGYAHADGLTVVGLDYIGTELQFLILLPDRDRSVDAVASALRATDFARWKTLGNETTSERVALYLPRFRVEGATLRLGEALRALGVASAFDVPEGSANFDRIAARKPDDYLFFSEVFHRTFIALDEEGTEAAAATAVAMSYAAGGAPPPKPIEVRVDRPFLFAIQHRASGTCLFLGRIADPR